MTKKLQARLAELERIHASRLEAGRHLAEAERPKGDSATEVNRAYLKIHGFNQGPDESLAETTGRALGCGSDELRMCIGQGRLGVELAKRLAQAR